MENQAFPEGLLPSFRLRVDKGQYESAEQLFRKHRFSESSALLKEALQNPVETLGTEEDPSVRDAAVLLAWNLHQLRDYDGCRQWLRDAVDDGLLPEGDPESDLIELWIRWSEGHYEEVIERTGAYVEAFSGRLDRLLPEFLFLRGSTRVRVGQHTEALEDCLAAHSFFKVLKKENERAEVCNLMGLVHFQQSQYEEALKWLHDSLCLNQDLGLTRRIGDNYLNIGLANYKRGDYPEAQRYLELAAQTHQEINSPNLLCRAKIALGNVSRLLRDFCGARSHLMAAYTLATDRRLPREECLALEFLGDVFRDEDKPLEARRYYARGLAIAKKIAPQGDLMAELLRRDGECLEMMDQAAASIPILERARRLAAKIGNRFEEGVSLRCQALAAAKMKDWRQARQRIEDAIAFLESIDARHELAIAHLVAAKQLEGQAGPKGKRSARALLENSLKHALAAQQLVKDLGLTYWGKEVDQVVSSLAWRHIGEVGAQDRKAGVVSPAEADAATEVIAVSTQMRAALQQCDSFAGFDEPVLITGDTGTGKELVARRIHHNSPRSKAPFVPVNCAAVPGTLFEREFFGHDKGAYTGAENDRIGYVEQADGGILFLDEIGELPLELQPKLLRLLQEGTYNRLGDPRERSADVRLVAATNAELDQLVAEGKFRQDLHYRLKILEVSLAPLRERREDIIPLLQYFLSKFAGRSVSVWHFFNNESVQALRRYAWPGNVREVIMVARRAYIGMETEGRTHVVLGSGSGSVELNGPARLDGASGASRSRILEVLQQTGGNKAEAARQFGVARQTLYRWLKRHGISA